MSLEMVDANLVRATVMIAAVGVSVVTDTRYRRIPNWLTLLLAVAGLGIGVVQGGWSGLHLSVAGFFLGGLVFLIPVTHFGWGMGDLKLVAALGAVGGPLFALWTTLYAMAVGGLFAVVWLGKRGQLAWVARSIQGDLRAGQPPSAQSGHSIPFAAPIAAGMVVALLLSPGLPG